MLEESAEEGDGGDAVDAGFMWWEEGGHSGEKRASHGLGLCCIREEEQSSDEVKSGSSFFNLLNLMRGG